MKNQSRSNSSDEDEDENNNKNVVTFEGGLITDSEGNILWDVSCFYCGIQIQRGAYGEGTAKRIVRLDSQDQHSCCMDCYERCSEIYLEECKTNEEKASFAKEFFAAPSRVFDVEEVNNLVNDLI